MSDTTPKRYEHGATYAISKDALAYYLHSGMGMKVKTMSGATCSLSGDVAIVVQKDAVHVGSLPTSVTVTASHKTNNTTKTSYHLNISHDAAQDKFAQVDDRKSTVGLEMNKSLQDSWGNENDRILYSGTKAMKRHAANLKAAGVVCDKPSSILTPDDLVAMAKAHLGKPLETSGPTK